MKFIRQNGALWAVAFSLLAFSQALHAWEHLAVFSVGEHCHEGSDHGHSHAPEPAGSSEDSGESHVFEHSHSPAIVEVYALVVFRSFSVEGFRPGVWAPEAPVRKIDYPPQLS